jgi:excinuclease ABC subunit B
VATLDDLKNKTQHDLSREIIEIETQMKKYAEELDFENAIACRDRLRRIQVELEKKNAR